MAKKHQELEDKDLAPKTVTERVLSSGAEFHSFKQNPEFEGNFIKEVLREVDSTDGQQKAGEVMGYLFANADGEEVIVGSAHAIKNAIEKNEIKRGERLRIVFLGNRPRKSGQGTFNRYHISLIEFK